MIALLLMSTTMQPAMAWKHTGSAWKSSDMPLEYFVSEECEESVPADYCEQVAAEGFAAWEAASCAEFEMSYQGLAPRAGMNSFDRVNEIQFEDPENDIEEPGTLAVSRSTPSSDIAFNFEGEDYAHIVDGDIMFNNNVQFTTDELVASGQCGGATNMRGVMTHEIGHFFGMGHSCDEGEACEAVGPAEATMFWSEGPCRRGAIDINEDDIQGFNALYGPSANFACSNEESEELASGVVPFDMKCVILSSYLDEITEVNWNFGDGGSEEGLNASHTYEEAGNYTIRVDVKGERDACGEDGWENTFRKVGYVRACDIPAADFTVEKEDGLSYRMLNNSDVSVYGCIQAIQWDIFEGEGAGGTPIASLSAWEPLFDFPETGTYTAVLNLGGPAGTGAAKLTFDVDKSRGEGRSGCDMAGVSAGFAGSFLAIGLVGLRRRRQS